MARVADDDRRGLTPFPKTPAMVRDAAVAVAISLGAIGCGDPMSADAGDPNDAGIIGPMPPPLDAGTDAGGPPPPMPPPFDAGDAVDAGFDAGIIAPMPPPLDAGFDAGGPPPPMPPPFDAGSDAGHDADVIAPMPPPMPPPPMPAP